MESYKLEVNDYRLSLILFEHVILTLKEHSSYKIKLAPELRAMEIAEKYLAFQKELVRIKAPTAKILEETKIAILTEIATGEETLIWERK